MVFLKVSPLHGRRVFFLIWLDSALYSCFEMVLYGSMMYYMRVVGGFIRISNVRNLMWPIGGPPRTKEGHWPNGPHEVMNIC